MAKEISKVVKQCKVLLLDIEGTTTSISFVKDKLFPYAEENVKGYLEGQWENDDVKTVVSALRKLALEDEEKKVDGVVTIPGEDASKEDQIEGLVKNVKWQMSADRKAGPLKQLQGLIWKKGYDNGDIKGHVYDDVLPALELWRSTEGHKIYIYSSGSVQAQKLLFGQSTAGDMLPHIDGHFDTAVGAKQESTSYLKIADEIGCKPEEILFLTDIPKEAEAAKAAGIQAALVSREGNAPLDSEATTTFPVLNSFSQLASSNKRKPESDQGDETTKAAKLLKTDIEVEKTDEADLKVKEKSIPSNEKADIPKDEQNVEEVEMKVVEVVEVTEVTTAEVDAEKVDVETVVMEDEAAKTEKKETESNANEKKVDEAIIITEIEEVEDKIVEEAAEVVMIDPVVEEPSTEETEATKLINVGDVLEKECDEILSKVQNVTNLENITAKPTLKPISEEMEMENTDSNDIADRILDTENDLDLNSDKETSETSMADEAEDKIAVKAAEKKADKVADEKAKDTTETPKTNDVESKTVVEKVEPAVKEPTAAGNGKESHVNGTLHGCGDGPDVVEPSKESRLSVDNGKDVNGANGDTNGAKDNGAIEEGQGDAKAVEVPEIKVKAVAERTDPVEQATEA